MGKNTSFDHAGGMFLGWSTREAEWRGGRCVRQSALHSERESLFQKQNERQGKWGEGRKEEGRKEETGILFELSSY